MSAKFSSGTLQRLNLSSPLTDASTSHSTSKRPLIILGILVGIFAISTAVLAVVLAMKSKSTTPIADNDLCVTPYCVKAANYLLESIDESVKPCEDFYHFVCGKWINNTRIPDDAGAANTFNLLRTQLDYNVVDLLTPKPTNVTGEPQAIVNARRLYHSCLNEQQIEQEGIDSILTIINSELGGWPLLQGSSWDNSTFDLLKVLSELRVYSNSIIFAVGTSTDEKNSTEYDIEIGQSDLGLGQRQFYTNESRITNAYRQFMIDLAKALSNETSPSIEQDVKDIYDFEKELATYHWTNDEQRSRQNETVRTTFAALPELLDTTFNFTEYLRYIYSWAAVTLVDNDIITVSEIEYLYNVSALLDRTPARVLQNYVLWRFMMHRADNMPKRFRSIKENFDHVFRGTTAVPARSVSCGNYVNGNMGFAVSKMYISKYFDDNARNQSFEMIANIRKAFIGMLEESTWMDTMSKNKAIEKALAINEKIGYPDYLTSDNVTQLEKEYEEYKFGSSYITNVMSLLQIRAREEFQILRKPVDRNAWSTAPTVVNAFYSPSRNQISFPAGILQMPFFDRDAPKYLNYGGIGVVIGHEITHGFDDTGRQFDKDGNRIPWWTDQTIDEFIKRKTCIVEQYSNYTIPEINMHSNGNLTQGEDIADNGGLRESFFAYRKWSQANAGSDKKLPGLSQYSSEQMFFINYAHTWCAKMTDSYMRNRVLSDVHSLGPFRVMGPTSNFDEFDRAFKCVPGQTNPSYFQGIELLSDVNYMQGFNVIQACPTDPAECSKAPRYRLYNPFSIAPNRTASWNIAQWNSHSNLSTNGTLIDDGRSLGVQWLTEDKRLILFQDGRVQFQVNGFHEYQGTYKAPDAPWVHLLMQQAIGPAGGSVPLSEVTELRWNLDVQLLYMDQHIQTGYDPNLHAGIFPLYMTIQNLLPGDSEYGKYFWLGISLYDDRVLMSPLYVNGDKGTGSLIYSPAFANFANISVHSKDRVQVNGDMMPFVRLGLEAAVERGFLNSTDLSKYYVGGMNIGWEVTGLNNGTIEIGNFSLKQYTAQNPKSYEFYPNGDPQGWQQLSNLSTYPLLNGTWIFSLGDAPLQLLSPILRIDTTVVKKIILRMTAGYVQLFWSRKTKGSFTQVNSIHTEPKLIEGWEEYIFDLSNQSRWHGIIRRLQINYVSTKTPHQFSLDYIRFAAK